MTSPNRAPVREATLALFHHCAAGCDALVSDPRETCAACVTELSGYLRPAQTPVTADEFVQARDKAIRQAREVIIARHVMKDHHDAA